VRLQAVFYRGHDPQWAFRRSLATAQRPRVGAQPDRRSGTLSGPEIDTVIVEMTHGFAHRLEPLTMVSYDVDIEGIVDLRTSAGRRAAGVKLVDIACPWELELAYGREPASWRVANRLRKTAAGILVPSFARGAREDMHNLVLWKWGPDLPHRVTAHDPSGRLPKNRLSWT
jgi:RES domain-containing protein